MDNTDTMAPVWSALRAGLVAIGAWLATSGYGDTQLYKYIELAAGGVLIVCPAIWGVVTAIQNARKKKEILTTGVNAGMALAASGEMLVTHDGKPVPATPSAAKAIVKTFG